MNKLSVTLIQSDLVWGNISENLKDFSEKLNRIDQTTDVVVLPEMFNTGFTMNVGALAETMEGVTVKWLLIHAKMTNAVILGSIIIKENGNYYNRLLIAFPDGSLKSYDKHHLFTLANEHKTFTAGQKRITFNYKGWHICPLVCYDLRFPVWARNNSNYDVLIYIASWPKPRIEAWDALLKARAIENMSYVVGVNRVGIDGNKLEYSGHSAVYDSLGKNIKRAKENKEAILNVSLSKKELKLNRKKLNFLEDRDFFEIN